MLPVAPHPNAHQTARPGAQPGATARHADADLIATRLFPLLPQVRFAHARIKPVFSGCGRRLEDTLAELRAGTTRVEDLPPITVVTQPGSGGAGTDAEM